MGDITPGGPSQASFPNADETEMRFTHKISSLQDKVSILQPPRLWACVLGRHGFCVFLFFFFSKMRHETHGWSVCGRAVLPKLDAGTDGHILCPDVTCSRPVWGEGVLAQGLCARASPRKKRKRYTSLSHSKCLITIIILLCVYPCWHMHLIHLNATWFSNIWKYIFLDFPSSPMVKALCTSNTGAQIWFLVGELDPTCCTVLAKKERKKENTLSTLLMLSHLSCIWLFATLWSAVCQAPPSLGFSRQEHGSGLPFSSPTLWIR